MQNMLRSSRNTCFQMPIFGTCAGFGVGLANQSVPLYLSEIAPPKMRGGLNNLFQVTCATISQTFKCTLASYWSCKSYSSMHKSRMHHSLQRSDN